VVDSAGVEIVHNPTHGIWQSGDGWTLEEVLSIGETIGDEAYQFGQIVSVDTDAAGNVYIADFQAQEVRVFDTEGVYTHTIGAPGAGPGEIGAGLSGVFALPDEVVVPDVGNFRINRFGYDGELLGSDLIDIAKGIPIRWDRIGDEVVVQLRVMVTEEGAASHGFACSRPSRLGTRVPTVGSSWPSTSRFVSRSETLKGCWFASSPGRMT
jgi:hypothetical protein